MTRMILDGTTNGQELVNFALAVLRGGGTMFSPDGTKRNVPDDPKSRMFVLHWLSDRCWGRAKQVVEVGPVTDHVEMPDMREKTLAELQQLAAGGDGAGDDIH